MGLADEGLFLDTLYEAAVDPDLWTPVLERVADALGGNSAWISRLNVQSGMGSTVTARIDDEMRLRYRAYYASINPFMTVPKLQARVVTSADWMDRGQLDRNEYFNDFMRPQDSFACAIFRLGGDGRDVCSLSVNRPRAHGDFDGADLQLAERLQPHIRRAFDLTGRFGDRAVLSDAAALDRSRHAVFVLGDGGIVRGTNQTAERLLRDRAGLHVAHGRLAAIRADEARRLEVLVGIAASDDPEVRSGGSMSLRTPRRSAPLSVTVTPLRSERLAVFGRRPTVLVSIADADPREPVSEAQLREAFDLTPAEARVALILMQGATAREAAAQLGVSFHTVRHQVQGVLDKTGARRRAELVARLSLTAGPDQRD